MTKIVKKRPEPGVYTARWLDVWHNDRIFAKCTRPEDAFLVAACLNGRAPVSKKVQPVKKKQKVVTKKVLTKTKPAKLKGRRKA